MNLVVRGSEPVKKILHLEPWSSIKLPKNGNINNIKKHGGSLMAKVVPTEIELHPIQ